MEIIVFLTFIGICFILLLFVGRGGGRGKRLAPRQRKSRSFGNEKLQTPANNALANGDELWRMRKRGNAMDVAKTNRYVPRSAEPEYDGYSRRDRHHLTSKPTHIKEEDHVDPVVKPVVNGQKDDHLARN